MKIRRALVGATIALWWIACIANQSPDAQAAPQCGAVSAALLASASVDPLACADTPGADPTTDKGPWTFQLSRIQLAPGDSLAPQDISSTEHDLLYVEQGTLTVFDEKRNSDNVYPPGAQVFLGPAENGQPAGYAVRNDAPNPLSYLRFQWVAPEPGAVSVSAASAGDVNQFPQVGDSSPDQLASMTVNGHQVPGENSVAFVARVNLPAGADLPALSFPGPVAEAVESGALTLPGLSNQTADGSGMDQQAVMAQGENVVVPSGHYVAIPTNTPQDTLNTLDAPTSLLIIGLLPASAPNSPSAEAALPDAFIGTWSGTGVQANPSDQWPMTVQFTGGAAGDPAVGTISYPSLGCSGQYILRSVDGDTIEATEHITSGDACVDGPATFTLLPDGSLNYSWSSPSGHSTATAALTKSAGDAGAGPSTTAQVAPSGQDIQIQFTADEWQGGLFRGDGAWYGRPWVAIYGSQSDYPNASLTFTLDAPPASDLVLTISGLDDEWDAKVMMEVSINDQSVFAGPSPFPNWDGVGHGEQAAWANATFAVPANLLQTGTNTITVQNLEQTANYGEPPYILLSDGTLAPAQ